MAEETVNVPPHLPEVVAAAAAVPSSSDVLLQYLQQNVAFKELRSRVRGNKVALMCGAGVSMAISNDGRTWSGLVEQYARLVQTILGLNEAWYEGNIAAVNLFLDITATDRLFMKINRICETININWTDVNNDELYKHRIAAQMILRRMSIDHPERGRLLHAMGALILTTNYDMVIEECIPTSRFSLSHVEALRIGIHHFMPGGPTLGFGLFQDPSTAFVVHIHGRYFDFGADHGFALTADEYVNQIMTQKFLEFMVPIASNKSLLFIGANGTLIDAHFMELWNRLTTSDSKITHYVLHSEQQHADVQAAIDTALAANPGLLLEGLCYGSDPTRSLLWDVVIPFLTPP